MTFNEPLSYFVEGEVDLLQIDGRILSSSTVTVCAFQERDMIDWRLFLANG